MRLLRRFAPRNDTGVVSSPLYLALPCFSGQLTLEDHAASSGVELASFSYWAGLR